MIGSLIGGALGLAGSIYGGIKASEAVKNVKGNIEQQQADNQAWYDRRYNEDYTQSATAQNILRQNAEEYKRRNAAAAGMAAVGGGTEESVAATKEANAKALADATANIAAAGDARKDRIEQQYMQNKRGLQGELNNMELAKANAIAQAASGFADAAGTAGMGIDELIGHMV